MSQDMPSGPPLSGAALTTLLSALREQHAGAPTVAPLITRVAHPDFRSELPERVAAALARVEGRSGGARPVPARTVIVPPNLGALIGAVPAAARGGQAADHTPAVPDAQAP